MMMNEIIDCVAICYLTTRWYQNSLWAFSVLTFVSRDAVCVFSEDRKETRTGGQQEPTLIFACWPLARKVRNTLFRPRARTPTFLLRDRKMGCSGVGMDPAVLQHQRHILAPFSSKHNPPDLLRFSLKHGNTHEYSASSDLCILKLQFQSALMLLHFGNSLTRWHHGRSSRFLCHQNGIWL